MNTGSCLVPSTGSRYSTISLSNFLPDSPDNLCISVFFAAISLFLSLSRGTKAGNVSTKNRVVCISAVLALFLPRSFFIFAYRLFRLKLIVLSSLFIFFDF